MSWIGWTTVGFAAVHTVLWSMLLWSLHRQPFRADPERR